jgi:ABC-2 type transport system permease protein
LAREAATLPAFLRRDLLLAVHEPSLLLGGLAELGLGALVIAFVDRLVDRGSLPAYGGLRPRYFEFALIGVAITLLAGMLFERLATALRRERASGTWEPLLATPAPRAITGVGLVAFDGLLIPVRIVVPLAVALLLAGARVHADGLLPAAIVVAALVSFVGGIAMLAARAPSLARLPAWWMVLLGAASGAFFPLSELPEGLEQLAEASPVAIALESVRAVMIGGGGWSALPGEAVLLAPAAAAGLAAAVAALRRAPMLTYP